MKVSALMSTHLYVISPEDSVEEAVRLLQQRGVRHLLVLNANELVGILSDRDLTRALDFTKCHHRKLLNIGGLFFLMEPILVREIMTSEPITIEHGALASEAATLLFTHHIGALPVVRKGELLGIITESDLLRYYASLPEQSRRPSTRVKPPMKIPAKASAATRIKKTKREPASHAGGGTHS